MKRALLAVLVCAAWVGAAGLVQPFNSSVWIDTLRIDSTETEYTDIYWWDNGGNLSLVVEAQDTSAVGFGDDSACVHIELYHVWPLGLSRKDVVSLRATDADSVIADSIDIVNMDSVAVCVHTAIADTNWQGDTTGWHFNTATVDSVSTTVRSAGALAYYDVTPTYSPGLRLKVTGKADNNKGGVGSRWIFRWFQTVAPVKAK
jgi:hypothetical protein